MPVHATLLSVKKRGEGGPLLGQWCLLEFIRYILSQQLENSRILVNVSRFVGH